MSYRTLLTQTMRRAEDLARLNAGKSKAARTAMIAMTTSSSIKVNARFIYISQLDPKLTSRLT